MHLTLTVQAAICLLPAWLLPLPVPVCAATHARNAECPPLLTKRYPIYSISKDPSAAARRAQAEVDVDLADGHRFVRYFWVSLTAAGWLPAASQSIDCGTDRLVALVPLH
jgi:hypothetical protein